MAVIQPGMTPSQGPSVSHLRQVFEQKAIKPEEPIRLMKGQTSTSGPRRTSELNKTETPPSTQSPQAAACLKTAENVHNKATIPFVTTHSGPYYEEKPSITQHITLSTPLEVKQERVTVEEKINTMVQWNFSPTEHLEVVNVQIMPQHASVETTHETGAHAEKQNMVVLDEPEAAMKGISSPEQPPNEFEEEVTAFLTQAEAMAGNIGEISHEQTSAALEIISKLKQNNEGFSQLKPETQAKFEAVSNAVQELHASLTEAAPQTTAPSEEHWSATIANNLASENPDAKVMETAINKMLADIESKAATNKGVIHQNDLEEARGVNDLLGQLKSHAGVSEEMKGIISVVHEEMSMAISHTETRVFLDQVGQAGRFDGIPKPYDNIGTSLGNVAKQNAQLTDHIQKFSLEKSKPKQDNPETQALREKIDTIADTIQLIANEGRDDLLDTLISQHEELSGLHSRAANKDPDIQKVETRVNAIINTIKAIRAAKAIFMPAFERLSADIAQFEKLGLTESHAKEYQQLTGIMNELTELLMKNGEPTIPTVAEAQAWASQHVDKSPNGIVQEISNKMTSTFQHSWYLKESTIDLSQINHVIDVFKSVAPDNTQNLADVQELANQFKTTVEEAHQALGSVRAGNSLQNLSAEQRQALGKMATSMIQISLQGEALSTALPKDHDNQPHRYQMAHANLCQGLANWAKTSIAQMIQIDGDTSIKFLLDLINQSSELQGINSWIKNQPEVKAFIKTNPQYA